jgi:hypothetical protein
MPSEAKNHRMADPYRQSGFIQQQALRSIKTTLQYFHLSEQRLMATTSPLDMLGSGQIGITLVLHTWGQNLG